MLKTKIFGNPFYWYIISFGISLFIYSWQWSDLYPKLTLSVITFFIITFLAALAIGYVNRNKFYFKYINESKGNSLVVSFILLGYFAEFVHNRGVPLFLSLNSSYYDYRDFGIPTFHVFLQTFSPFYTIYLFHQYISKKNKLLIVYIISLLIMSILIINRGSVIMTLTSCLIIYILEIRVIRMQTIIKLCFALLLVFYAFGYVGFVRSFKDNETYFLKIAAATDAFQESIVPKEYFWFYLYASSPIATFQNAVTEVKEVRYNVINFSLSEMLPDFISKRIVDSSDPDSQDVDRYLIARFLTVGSTFYNPYRRMGWTGCIVIFMELMLIACLYIRVISSKSSYHTTAIAIVCTVVLYSIFDNMIYFSGLSFQLIYPLILSKLERYKLILPKIRFKLKFNL